jgi:hypothetical protein
MLRGAVAASIKDMIFHKRPAALAPYRPYEKKNPLCRRYSPAR